MYLLSDPQFSCTEKGLKTCSRNNTLKWSNAGVIGMIQEGYRMYVFSGEENALRHKHLLHVQECPSR